MDKFLKKIKDISELSEWIKNPTYNPITKQNDIELSLKEDSNYVMLYNKCFKILRKDNKKTQAILKILPKNHLLFDNKIDYLYVYYNLNNEKYPYKGKDEKYLLYENYKKSDKDAMDTNIIFDKLSYIIDFRTDIKEENYETVLINECYEYLITLIQFFILKIKNKILKNYTLRDLETEFIDEAYVKMTEINDINKFFNLINYDFKNKSYENDDLNINIEEAIKISIDVFKMIDYRNNGKDVIEIITENKLKIIEDPLINLLSKKEFKNIDITNLELPEQNINDIQYKNLTEEYTRLLNKFNEDKEKATSKSPPKRPVLDMPNKTKITIGIHKIPKQNYTDDEYKNLKSQYNKNKLVIDMYKQLINTGFLDLKSSKSISSSSQSISMLNKSREDIIKDDLFDDTIVDDSRLLRCINDTEIISQDDFANTNYPLAKLQLMTKLKIKDASKKILRTDCYYTPNLYNYLITLANDKKPFTDPYNGKYILTEKDINGIMKIMKIIDPKIERPRYIKNSNDKQFMIDAEIDDYNIYNIYVYRLFGETRFRIVTLFVFPADIEVKDTGSADITSAALVVKIVELFNNGKLMETYLPPYNDDGIYLLPDINYNTYNNTNKWITMTKKKKIDLFKRMATEINAI
jgi:hypothetical protein